MVIHDTECPYEDLVSLNYPTQPNPNLSGYSGTNGLNSEGFHSFAQPLCYVVKHLSTFATFAEFHTQSTYPGLALPPPPGPNLSGFDGPNGSKRAPGGTAPLQHKSSTLTGHF